MPAALFTFQKAVEDATFPEIRLNGCIRLSERWRRFTLVPSTDGCSGSTVRKDKPVSIHHTLGNRKVKGKLASLTATKG